MKPKVRQADAHSNGFAVRGGSFVVEILLSDMESGIERIERHYFKGDLTVRLGKRVGKEMPFEIGEVEIRPAGKSFKVTKAEKSWLRGSVDSKTGCGQAVGVLFSKELCVKRGVFPAKFSLYSAERRLKAR